MGAARDGRRTPADPATKSSWRVAEDRPSFVGEPLPRERPAEDHPEPLGDPARRDVPRIEHGVHLRHAEILEPVADDGACRLGRVALAAPRVREAVVDLHLVRLAAEELEDARDADDVAAVTQRHGELPEARLLEAARLARQPRARLLLAE